MCLAVPAKVIALKEGGKKVLVEQAGMRNHHREVNSAIGIGS